MNEKEDDMAEYKYCKMVLSDQDFQTSNDDWYVVFVPGIFSLLIMLLVLLSCWVWDYYQKQWLLDEEKWDSQTKTVPAGTTWRIMAYVWQQNKIRNGQNSLMVNGTSGKRKKYSGAFVIRIKCSFWGFSPQCHLVICI